MEGYVVVSTTAEHRLADKTCQALEDAGIPVVLEHREVVLGARRAQNYRVLVPSEHSQMALKLVGYSSGTHLISGAGRIH